METLKYIHAGVSREDIADLNLIHILYSQAPVTFTFPVLAGTCLVFLLWNVSRLDILLSWFLVITLHSIYRYILLRQFNNASLKPEDTGTWLDRFVLSACISGILWGIAPIILVTYSGQMEFIIYNGITVLMTCGLSAGAAISYAVSPKVLVSYTLPALIPPAVYLITLGDIHNSSLGGYILLYFVFITLAAIRMNRVLRRFIKMEQEKTEACYKYEKLKTVYADYRRKVGI